MASFPAHTPLPQASLASRRPQASRTRLALSPSPDAASRLLCAARPRSAINGTQFPLRPAPPRGPCPWSQPSRHLLAPASVPLPAPPHAGLYPGEEPGPAPPDEEARREQASKRVDRVSKNFRNLGFVGFWGQLACNIVAAVILAFSVIMSGSPTNSVSTYLTFAGIAMGFVSVFWSFGYMRLADKLKVAVDDPMKAPTRASVVSSLSNGIIVNVFGLGATLLGLQATVGLLVAKALTSSTPMYGAVGTPPGFNPVLALDVFLVQASGNTALAHFLGLVLSLELLRSTTRAPPPPSTVIPRPA